MGDFVTLHEEPQRHAGMPPVGQPLPPHLHSHHPVRKVDAVPPHARGTRYHTGPVVTQQYGNPIIARHSRPAITPAAITSSFCEERSPTAEEMRELHTHWHVYRFQNFNSEKKSGWQIVPVPETSKYDIASKVQSLNRTTVPVLHKLNELEGEILDQINAVQREHEIEFGPNFHTELMQIEDIVLVVEKEKTTKERGRGYERDHKASKHHHRSRHSERRSKSRGVPPSRSRERKEKRVSVTAYFRTSPKPDVDLHMSVHGAAEEARPRTPPRYAYHVGTPEEGRVHFQQPSHDFPSHHQHHHHPQQTQHSQHAQQPQHRHDPRGPPQHQPQHPLYPPAGDRQFSQMRQPSPPASRNAPPQMGGNTISRGESPATQGRPPTQAQGYPQGHPQGHQHGKPQGEQQAQCRPPPQGQVQPRAVPLQQVPPQTQKDPAQRQTEYRGNGGPAATVAHPSNKPGILKPQPSGQGLSQRRASFTPQFTSPPGSPSTDESLFSEVFSEEEEEYDSDTAVSMESFPEHTQFAGPRKATNAVANEPPPPPLPRFMESAAHGMPPKLARQMPLQPPMMQQQHKPQQRHVVKGRQPSFSNHMATERMYAPTPPPLFPIKQRPRVDVQEIEQNAYEAGRADAREEVIKLAERVTAAAVSSSTKSQIMLPERSRPQAPPQILHHQSPVPPQPVRWTTLPPQAPHSGVRRVQGMEARRNSFAQTPPLDRYESERTVDRRRDSLVDRDFDRRRVDDAEYVVEYGAGAYEERQCGSGIYHRSSPPLPYSPKAEERFRRPSVNDDRDRQYETVRVRVGGERLPRREEEPVYVRGREIERGGFLGVDGGAVRFGSSNTFNSRPGLAKRTATYPIRYSRDH
ncbi:hypothetical protein QBC36DRAFT_135276 [Triangularia setosa]|uniref:Uncharacterized protein n=1 Tax=Triangularia setosa TaxID=2587417 RepID=A0AAN6WC47_9PEZI|nr:hypothetical protein QBC36DRAFT_135276 [Podospora setosa]